MRYYKETDSLYIDLNESPSKGSLEVAPGIVLDFDEENNIVGIDIDRASQILNLSKLEILSVPSKNLYFHPWLVAHYLFLISKGLLKKMKKADLGGEAAEIHHCKV
jgi:uncharacterized protein YuzE